MTIFFPTVLFGNPGETWNRWWPLFNTNNCGADQLAKFLLSQHEVALREDDKIILSCDKIFCVPGNYWYLAWIARAWETRDVVFPEGKITKEIVNIIRGDQDLILLAMEKFWFALTLWTQELVPAFLEEGPRFIHLFLIPVVKKWIYWLPEINEVYDQCYYGLSNCLLIPYKDRLNPQNWNYFWVQFIYNLYLCDLSPPPGVFFQIAKNNDKNVLATLLKEKIIKKNGDRYEIK